MSNLVPVPGNQFGGIGNQSYHFTLLDGKNDDGSVLVASGPSAGNFKISNTTGTSISLVGETANNNTKTDKVLFAFTVPPWADPTGSSNYTIVVNAGYSNNAGGTLGTHTIAAAAYSVSGGVYSSNLVLTPPSISLTSTTQADYSFVISNPNKLTPGARAIIQLTLAMQETASGGNIIGAIYSCRIAASAPSTL